METLTTRQKLHGLIDQMDDKTLELFYQDVLAKRGNEVVAYTVKGQPLSREALAEQLNEARQQIKDGNYISLEDLEKEGENW